jgi:hypothetical protein
MLRSAIEILFRNKQEHEGGTRGLWQACLLKDPAVSLPSILERAQDFVTVSLQNCIMILREHYENYN